MFRERWRSCLTGHCKDTSQADAVDGSTGESDSPGTSNLSLILCSALTRYILDFFFLTLCFTNKGHSATVYSLSPQLDYYFQIQIFLVEVLLSINLPMY